MDKLNILALCYQLLIVLPTFGDSQISFDFPVNQAWKSLLDTFELY